MNLAAFDWIQHTLYGFSAAPAGHGAAKPSRCSTRSRSLWTLTIASLVALSLIIPTGPAEAVINPAQRLYRAWRKNDKRIAEKVAKAEVVNALFSRPWRKSDQWQSTSCTGAARSVYCTWERPSEKLVIRYKNDPTAPKPVNEVRFEAS
jgi:hypothetical protein